MAYKIGILREGQRSIFIIRYNNSELFKCSSNQLFIGSMLEILERNAKCFPPERKRKREKFQMSFPMPAFWFRRSCLLQSSATYKDQLSQLMHCYKWIQPKTPFFISSLFIRLDRNSSNSEEIARIHHVTTCLQRELKCTSLKERDQSQILKTGLPRLFSWEARSRMNVGMFLFNVCSKFSKTVRHLPSRYAFDKLQTGASFVASSRSAWPGFHFCCQIFLL